MLGVRYAPEPYTDRLTIEDADHGEGRMRKIGPALLCALLLTSCKPTSKSTADPEKPVLGAVEAQTLQSLCLSADVENPAGADDRERAVTLQGSLDACDRILSEFPDAKGDPALTRRAWMLREKFVLFDRLAEIEELARDGDYTQAREKLESVRSRIGTPAYEKLSAVIEAAQNQVKMSELDAKFPGLSAHAKKLHLKYADRLTFKTEVARRAVEGFTLDCRAKDRRFLPLVNVVFAKLAEIDREDMHLETVADSRGDDVRVTDRLVTRDGQIINEVVAFEISKWNEITPRSSSMDALYNACFMGWGEIWVLPATQP